MCLSDGQKLAKRALLNLNFSEAHAEVYVRARGKCEYCGIDLVRDRIAYAGIQIDHIEPVSAGGTSDHENLALACNICNSIKSNWEPKNGDTREQKIQLAKAFISDKLRPHDALWIKVNEALRDIWWNGDDT